MAQYFSMTFSVPIQNPGQVVPNIIAWLRCTLRSTIYPRILTKIFTKNTTYLYLSYYGDKLNLKCEYYICLQIIKNHLGENSIKNKQHFEYFL